jgi:hypothetical protein
MTSVKIGDLGQVESLLVPDHAVGPCFRSGSRLNPHRSAQAAAR